MVRGACQQHNSSLPSNKPPPTPPTPAELRDGHRLSEKIAEGTPVIAFMPDARWLTESRHWVATKALFGADHAYVHTSLERSTPTSSLTWVILAHRVEQPISSTRLGPAHVNDLDTVSWDTNCDENCTPSAWAWPPLDAGGITYGFSRDFRKLFDQASYGVDSASGLLDYGAIAAQVREFRSLCSWRGTRPTPGIPISPSWLRSPTTRGYFHGRHGPLRWAGGRESAGR